MCDACGVHFTVIRNDRINTWVAVKLDGPGGCPVILDHFKSEAEARTLCAQLHADRLANVK